MRRAVFTRIVLALGLVTIVAATPRVLADSSTADEPGNPTAHVKYDGKLVFIRLRYDMPGWPKGLFVTHEVQEVPWSHDLPDGERNLMQILEAVTHVEPYMGPEGGKILSLYDPDLFKFPLAYMSEPGYWTQTDDEAKALGDYLLKGGFLMLDDFRGPAHWANFEREMRRVLPFGRLIELDATHPIFHSFFDIEELDIVRPYQEEGHLPIFYGIFEDNDPRKRLMVVANFNNDISEYWQYSDRGFFPIDLSNEAYKFGVNYVVYALTH
jgi:hypothetical protein